MSALNRTDKKNGLNKPFSLLKKPETQKNKNFLLAVLHTYAYSFVYVCIHGTHLHKYAPCLRTFQKAASLIDFVISLNGLDKPFLGSK